MSGANLDQIYGVLLDVKQEMGTYSAKLDAQVQMFREHVEADKVTALAIDELRFHRAGSVAIGRIWVSMSGFLGAAFALLLSRFMRGHH